MEELRDCPPDQDRECLLGDRVRLGDWLPRVGDGDCVCVGEGSEVGEGSCPGDAKLLVDRALIISLPRGDGDRAKLMGGACH